MYIDADAHVDENSETWSYFPQNMAHLRPAEMLFAPGEAPHYLSAGVHNDGLMARGLFVDGHVWYRRTRSDELTQTTADMRELYDVPARLKHMDEIGVDVQVIYPSILLHEMTRRPEVEIALCESYNRWIADRCSDSGGRLRWMAVLPLRSIHDALAELERVQAAGAVGIFKRGYESGGRRAGDAWYHPVYARCEEMGLAVGIHASGPFTGTAVALSKTQQPLKASLYVQDAFLSLMMSGTCAKFPNLRFGFVEAGSGWVPNAVYEANYDEIAKAGANRDAVAARAAGGQVQKLAPSAHFEEILAKNQVYVTCEPGEDLPLIVSLIGDGSLCVGTDYGHSDRAAILYAHTEIASWSNLSKQSIERITETNAQKFYDIAPF
jgi:predicted TIM-barrel fold metal-dependent hydrolase